MILATSTSHNIKVMKTQGVSIWPQATWYFHTRFWRLRRFGDIQPLHNIVRYERGRQKTRANPSLAGTRRTHWLGSRGAMLTTEPNPTACKGGEGIGETRCEVRGHSQSRQVERHCRLFLFLFVRWWAQLWWVISIAESGTRRNPRLVVRHCSRTASRSASGVQCTKSGGFWHSRGALTPRTVHRTLLGAPYSLHGLTATYS